MTAEQAPSAPAVAEPVAQVCAGDQEHRVRDGIPGDHELQIRAPQAWRSVPMAGAATNTPEDAETARRTALLRERREKPWSPRARRTGRRVSRQQEIPPPDGDGILIHRSLTTQQSVDPWS
ncbi:hypothetical protein GCM10010129_10910 [Streptomyces fumigatiscleroticus]|nr:hypothetical protein GCM10010129_10910 [Streptomyces fumigatiscleroticus]